MSLAKLHITFNKIQKIMTVSVNSYLTMVTREKFCFYIVKVQSEFSVQSTFKIVHSDTDNYYKILNQNPLTDHIGGYRGCKGRTDLLGQISPFSCSFRDKLVK